MPWTKPDFVEISLAMEVTGYVNTDEQAAEEPVPNSEFRVPSSTQRETLDSER